MEKETNIIIVFVDECVTKLVQFTYKSITVTAEYHFTRLPPSEAIQYGPEARSIVEEFNTCFILHPSPLSFYSSPLLYFDLYYDAVTYLR